MIRDQKIVCTFSTIPGRYDSLKQSMLSLKNQTYKPDVIYLTIPKISTRFKTEYPPIPDDIAELCKIIYIDTDFGPLTKLYGALISEHDSSTCIISCDDDLLFQETFIETLYKYHKLYPESVICGSGVLIKYGILGSSIYSSVKPINRWSRFLGYNVDENGRDVDVILGGAGVLYYRGAFCNKDYLYEDIFKYSLMDSSIFHNDDVLISGYLSKNQVKRKIFNDIPVVEQVEAPEGLSKNTIKMLWRMNTAIEKVKEFGFFPETEYVAFDETIFIKITMAVIFLMMIVIISLYYIFYYDDFSQLINIF